MISMSELNGYTVLRNLLQNTALLTGEAFLKASAASFANQFNADFVFITQALERPTNQVRVLAAWCDGKEIEGWDFDLAGTPCDLIYQDKENWEGMRSGKAVAISEDVCRRFVSMRDTTYESFIGVPLWSSDRTMIGHVALFFNRRLDDHDQKSLVFELVELFAYKVQAELNRMLLEQVRERVLTDLREANERLAHESVTDFLTQLYNRRHFNQRAQESFARFKRLDEPYALILLDVDYFKQINDRYGHSAGDDVLRGLAQVLCENTRTEEPVFRTGGEEFAILCHGVFTEEKMDCLVRRINQKVKNYPFKIDQKEFTVTTSIGAAFPNATDSSWDAIVARADKALYVAKAEGRDRAVVAAKAAA
jgi:diguanylate cyclase (GGDEF)-like protein